MDISNAKPAVGDARTIVGNVGPSTGNVEAVGDVRVTGDVCDLFEVRAGGAVVVQGVIGAAQLKTGGDVDCTGGISGKGKAVCIVGGNVRSRHISNATVETRGNIVCQGTVWESKVRCSGDLNVGAAPIAASIVTVAGSIDCGSLGLASGAATLIEIGIDEFLRRDVVKAAPEIARLRKRQEQIQTAAAPLKARAKMLSPKEREQAMELAFEADEVQQSFDGLTRPLLAVHTALATKPASEIRVSGTIHPGVTIRFPRHQATTTCSFTGNVKVMLRKVGVTAMQIFVVQEEEGKSTPLTTKPFADPAFEGADWLPKTAAATTTTNVIAAAA